MAQDGQRVTCDLCPGKRKERTWVDSFSFKRDWETAALEDGSVFHLCPTCSQGIYMECVRCRRNNLEHIEIETWCSLGEGEFRCWPCVEDERPEAVRG